MEALLKCANCREEITAEAIEVDGKFYCCEACAFEGSQRIGSICGRRDTLEASMRYLRKSPKRTK